MRTLLVLSPSGGFVEALRAVLDPNRYRLVAHAELRQAEQLLRSGSIDGCIVEADLTDVRAIRMVEQVRRLLPHGPVIIYADRKQWEWEEEAYLLGVTYVLEKPVRGRLVNAMLERLWQSHNGDILLQVPTLAAPAQAAIAPAPPDTVKTLETLIDFSSVLTYTFSSEDLVKRFLLVLRQIIGVNRAAIFLRKPPSEPTQPEDQVLRAACAVGVSSQLLDHFDLTLQGGIGAHLHRYGRILRSNVEPALSDQEIQKEFNLLGAQVAVPIFDRESLLGVVVFDSRLTGEPFTNEELALVFRWLEQLGLAIKNSWAHDFQAASHAMMADILSQLESACVVIGSDLVILHANRAARRYFVRPGSRSDDFAFSDLPQALGSRVFQVLSSGTGVAPFKYHLPNNESAAYQVTILPFKHQASSANNAALLLMEDITQSERNQQLEIETANLRLVKSMAERLAHEIGNAVVPLSTHEQLLKQKYPDPEFRASLGNAMADSVKRISRLAKQMFFLARENFEPTDRVPLNQLIEEAFKDAQQFHSGKAASLHLETDSEPVSLTVERGGMRHALSEVMLNALQASAEDSKVTVLARRRTDPTGATWTQIEVSDPGQGFGGDSAGKAMNPFYTTRNVGIGLGLTVARKIIEKHRGKIEIAPGGKERHGVVVISLPSN
jgi:nitrogen-specific signal transduction histidine kinase/DNA-binding response OmpR family regulator